MNEHDVLKKNHNFYIGVGGTVLEGLLSGSLFMLLYSVMQFLWSGQFDMNRVLALTGIIAVVFLLRILIYSYGYTKAQIGGAEVSKNIRLFMGDHLKRIPLSRFTQGQTGDYINTITSDVNNYEKILTHKVGDLAKNFALSLMLIVFVRTCWITAVSSDFPSAPASHRAHTARRGSGSGWRRTAQYRRCGGLAPSAFRYTAR